MESECELKKVPVGWYIRVSTEKVRKRQGKNPLGSPLIRSKPEQIFTIMEREIINLTCSLVQKRKWPLKVLVHHFRPI